MDSTARGGEAPRSDAEEVVRDLYGGAMRWCIPQGFDDVSDFRQVPDNQEVFTHATTGVCIILELMARQGEVPHDQCGEHFFRDLAESNKSVASAITIAQRPLSLGDIPNIPCGAGDGSSPVCEYACLVGGTQLVSKFTNEAGRENQVFVAMAILRFPSPVATDILVTVTAPQAIADGSSERRVVDHTVTPDVAMAVLQRLLLTLQVNDWGLFVSE